MGRHKRGLTRTYHPALCGESGKQPGRAGPRPAPLPPVVSSAQEWIRPSTRHVITKQKGGFATITGKMLPHRQRQPHNGPQDRPVQERNSIIPRNSPHMRLAISLLIHQSFTICVREMLYSPQLDCSPAQRCIHTSMGSLLPIMCRTPTS